MKWKHVQQELKEAGAHVQSREGSHEVWKLPNGVLFTVICIRPNDEVPASYVSRLKRAKKGIAA
jgi:predicted RNA binding protein YcfA (HicA-like mRNA interferase family)